MKFHGNFKTIPLKSALQKIVKDVLTGNLKLQTKELGEVDLFFNKGELTHYQSRHLSDIHWPKVLLDKGVLTKADFDMMASQGVKGLAGIVSSQVIEEIKAASIFKKTIEEEFYSLFFIADSEFSFESANETLKKYHNLQLFSLIKFNIKTLLTEAARLSEGSAEAGGISNSEIYDKVKDKEKTVRPKLGKEEVLVFDLINGARSVFEVLKESGVSKQEVGVALKKLIDLQGVKICKAPDLLARASELSASQDFESASKLYLRLVEIEKTVLSHHELLAETYVKLHKIDKAVEEIEYVCKKYIAQKEFKKANDGFKKILELDSNKLIVHELIANNYIEMGLKTEAVAELKKLMELYMNGGFVDKAITVYPKIVTLEPENIELMGTMAKACVTSGDRIQAVELWNKMSDIYVSRNMIDDAIEVLKKAIKLEPDEESSKLKLDALINKKGSAKRKRTIILGLVGVASICLLFVFGPRSYHLTFPGTPSFDQEVERCKLISTWLKKKNINEISILGMSDTLTTILKKEGLKANTSPSLDLGLKSIEGKASTVLVKGFIINEAVKDLSVESLQKYFEAGGVIYFRGFDSKLTENGGLCDAIYTYLKKGQICVVLPKFPEVDVRTLSLTKRVLSENYFIDDTNAIEFENWRVKLAKIKAENEKLRK
jgi:tetratricopeptide (TPR) repeat protein